LVRVQQPFSEAARKQQREEQIVGKHGISGWNDELERMASAEEVRYWLDLAANLQEFADWLYEDPEHHRVEIYDLESEVSLGVAASVEQMLTLLREWLSELPGGLDLPEESSGRFVGVERLELSS
jgi:hypothetical protein